MKKFLFLGAMAAMLLGTASCSNDMEPQLSDGTVTFKVELPGHIDSRTIADGKTATKLDVACYDANGNKLTVEPTVKTDFVNREATVTYKLVKGQTYNFSFFAHAEGAPYTFTPGDKLENCTFTVNNYTDPCNAETRDAFYAVLEDYEVTTTETTVTLYRPFAQLNFGADDVEAAATAGIIPSQSKVTVSKAATTFNLKSGEASGEAAVAFTLADLPSDPKTLTVDSKDYRWMEMCYFLVPNNEANVDVEMTVTTKDANDVAREDVTVPVTNVPVKKNHRTNIVGSLFTQDANFKVIIDQNFDEPDYNIESNATYYEANASGALEDIIAQINNDQPEKAVIKVADGVTLTWQTGASHGSTPLIDATNSKTQELVIEGQGENSTFEAQGAGVGPIRLTNGGTIVFKNMNIVDNSVSYAETAWEFSQLEFSGNLRFENCTIKDGIALEGTTANNDTDLDAEFTNCKFISNTVTSDANPNPTSIYIVWISGGTSKFTNCEFTGYRGAKIHEAYGSNVDAVYFDNCYFHDLSKKPGMAIGTVDAPTIISIKNSRFINCQPGDQGLYMYESDTNVSTFNFINENNTVQND